MPIPMVERTTQQLHRTDRDSLLIFFGTLQFHIETMEECVRYAEEHPNSDYWMAKQADADELSRFIAKKEEVRAVLCHAAPRKPELGK